MEYKDIKKLVEENAPEGKVSGVDVEGPKVVIYSNDLPYFIENNNEVRDLASLLKKRILLRSTADKLMPPEKAKDVISGLISKDANIIGIDFNEYTREVYIEAEKLGLVIGKRGYILDEITKKTCWVPKLLRKPPIDSEVIRSVRKTLFESKEERQKILKSVGR